MRENEENEKFKEIEETEEAELARFGEKAIRAPRGGAFERLLCQHLVLSVSTDPINSLIHSCRAALSLPEPTAKQLEIDKQKVSDILTVALNFQQAKMEKDGATEYYSIHWSFESLGEEGFNRYIKPWFTTVTEWWVPHAWAFNPELRKEYYAKPFYERFYISSSKFVPSTFRGLLSAFVAWAYPHCEELNNKVSTQVSPTTYAEILGMFTKFKEGEE